MKIRCFLHRGRLNKFERLCIQSFVHHHGSIELFSYEPILNVPEGVIERSAEEILPRTSDAFRFNSGHGIASIVRWKTLLDHGGCFITLDILCLRPLRFATDIVFGRKSDVDFYRWGMDVLIFPPGHPACAYMLDRCLRPHFSIAGDNLVHRLRKEFRRRFTRSIRPIRPWKVGGEYGFQSAVEKFELESFAQPSPVFYPVHEARWLSPFDRTFAEDLDLLPMTRGIALNLDAAQRAGFDFNTAIPTDSLVGHYISQYNAVA